VESTRRFSPEGRFSSLPPTNRFMKSLEPSTLIEWRRAGRSRKISHTGTAFRNRVIDQTLHSLFGASKISADMLVPGTAARHAERHAREEGCLTGPSHSGTQLHGFTNVSDECALTSTPYYTVFGYKGKAGPRQYPQCDLIRAFDAFPSRSRSGRSITSVADGQAAPHVGGVALIEITGRELNWTYRVNPVGDHIWWISDISFQNHYPGWALKYDVRAILQIAVAGRERWLRLRPVLLHVDASLLRANHDTTP